MALFDVSIPLWQLLAAAFATYLGWTCIYRRFFHPLAKIPGPFLPAVTLLYQSFYNGRYYLEIARMHEKYGPSIQDKAFVVIRGESR